MSKSMSGYNEKLSFDVTLSQINHYQKKLIKYEATGETEKVLGCIHKLKYLPVTVSHLEKTGVGKSINALRHRNGIIGEKARALVNKWKTMVDEEEQEEQAEEYQNQTNEDPPDDPERAYLPTTSPYIENNEEEYDPSDEGDRLQIQEEQAECEEPDIHATYNPGGNSHLDEDDEDDDSVNAYNPRTSREDYVAMGESVPASYNPSLKEDETHYTNHETSDKSSLLNGNNHSIQNKKTNKHPKTEVEGKHKKKKHKSKEHEGKHKSGDKSSSSSHQKKSKHKAKSREKEEENSKVKRKSSSHSSQHLREVSSTPSPKRHRKSEGESAVVSQKTPEQSHSHNKERSHSKSKEKKPHKSSKSSKDDGKSTKRKREETVAESSSGFEAALMGMESTPTKKKKKKKSRDKESSHLASQSPQYIPMPVKDTDSSKHPKSPANIPSPTLYNIQSDKKSSTKSKSSAYDPLTASGREHLPQLPSTFDDTLCVSQLMPNYKPLPQVPQRHQARDPFDRTDEEALNYMLSSKSNKQRRIYAGKSSGLSSVPSLFDICIRVLQENIDALEATGGIPFDLLKPVLEKATPQQLLTLEDYNPYLLDDTDVLWSSHCKKHFKNKKREDTETWRDMFFRCTDEHDEKMRTVTESLHKKYSTKVAPKRTTQLAYVNTFAKPPKSVARAQAKYGTASTAVQAFKPSKSDETQRGGTSSSSSSSNNSNGNNNSSSSGVSSSNNLPPRPDRPFPNKPVAVKKPKVAPVMAKARLLLKKVCRR